ncbi:uncharacterized protein Bfra_005977 [Botrytis fragariae]|uniref:Uncharacterized protein n=1 Tax=Botrytis fragariae TaxID=1964551 RepID=A0A8H6AS64_9HELO|nr:uncharacterized protein Bfra_005977 [Botrytis fragariae]KAF5872616.1 hypothetical protein Bfra_005977 [Botrytis fragariae]
MAEAETGAWHEFSVGVLWDTCVLVTVEYFDFNKMRIICVRDGMVWFGKRWSLLVQITCLE